jgi:hypothetical protein
MNGQKIVGTTNVQEIANLPFQKLKYPKLCVLPGSQWTILTKTTLQNISIAPKLNQQLNHLNYLRHHHR